MLTLPPAPAAPALLSPFSVDDETIKITIQSDKKQDKEDDKETKDKCEENKKPTVTLLTGTYDPRRASFGTLRQYTLASQGMFLDYLKGDGPSKAEVIGVGSSGGSFLHPMETPPSLRFSTWAGESIMREARTPRPGWHGGSGWA